jgi:hypothetical protein
MVKYIIDELTQAGLSDREISQMRRVWVGEADFFDYYDTYEKLFNYYMDTEQIPYRFAKARDATPDEWMYEHWQHLGEFERPGGPVTESKGRKMKITKRQLQRIIAEERKRLVESESVVEADSAPELTDHHWPRVDWDHAVGELTDKWAEGELKAWEPDPSSTKDGELSNAEAKEWYEEQLDTAAMDFEAELVVRIRKIALATMKEFTERLMNGEYDR